MTETEQSPLRSAKPARRYRLDIVAPSAVDLVTFAGGWVLDRVASGWRVVAIVDDLTDDRPLRILGAHSTSLETALSSHRQRGHPHTLAAPAELFECDVRVRGWVLSALDRGLAEVALWGSSCPQELTAALDLAEHRLTSFAQVFKTQALVAAGVADTSVGPTETFYARPTTHTLVDTDLHRWPTGGLGSEFEIGPCPVVELRTASAGG